MPGGGKSTLRNSIIGDFIACNPERRVFLWLSEERVEDFMLDLSFNTSAIENLENIYIYSEQDNFNKEAEQEQLIANFHEAMIRSNCDLFVFDNITTSKLYGSGFKEQEYFSNSLKADLQKLECTNVIFAHTSSEIKGDHAHLIDMNDIRGNKNLVNLAEFVYVLQSFQVKEKIFTTIRIEKHRSQPCTNKMFVFNYDNNKRIYDFDKGVDFEIFNGIFAKRNKLGAKKTSKSSF